MLDEAKQNMSVWLYEQKKGCPLEAAFLNKMNFLEVEVQVDRSTAVISIDTKR